jgi:hemerythrin
MWKEKYNIGHEQIDKQHQYLVDILNSIDEKDGILEKEEALELFLKLKNYTDIHFSDEEELMEKINYPDIDIQKEDHAFFKNKIEEIQKKITSDQEVNIKDVSLLLSDWLINHILIRDSELSSYIKNEKEEYIHLDI